MTKAHGNSSGAAALFRTFTPTMIKARGNSSCAAARSTGFGPGGVQGGSAAAGMMRTGGGTTPNVVFGLQSVGATGRVSSSAQGNLSHPGGSTAAAVHSAGFGAGGVSRGSAGAGMMAAGGGRVPPVVSQLQAHGATGGKK